MRSFWGLLSHQKTPSSLSFYLLKTQLQSNSMLAPVASAIASDPPSITASPVPPIVWFQKPSCRSVCCFRTPSSGLGGETVVSTLNHMPSAPCLITWRCSSSRSAFMLRLLRRELMNMNRGGQPFNCSQNERSQINGPLFEKFPFPPNCLIKECIVSVFRLISYLPQVLTVSVLVMRHYITTIAQVKPPAVPDKARLRGTVLLLSAKAYLQG